MSTPVRPVAAPGWYDDGSGRWRWWDGYAWQGYAPQPQPLQAPMRTANAMPVSYTRQQTGHSITLHILLIFVFVGMITVPYYSASPNHYWHI